MDLKNLVQFLKYYTFSQNDNNYLKDLSIYQEGKIKMRKNNIIRINSMKSKNSDRLKNRRSMKGKKINNYLGEGYENPTVNKINSKLRDKLIRLGRKALLNILKHFTFYDYNKKFISKYGFNKILENNNIKLSVDDIDKIYKNYEIGKIRNAMD